ncbi:hypothetical protein SAMN05444004_1155 [Jannaschia faecimaris]|uniref:HTH crp-type domain-containing protein n=1 Tax=Jannaschia faecimaris TaxID=1244108 RepID=A0A1H3T4Q5_9RHOB|nr:hypothetical protein [Jannaschia faecimaris]SDZ45030.1 hypothetical protein SAMN05444004_1155 [Jannaschia faecimaris]
MPTKNTEPGEFIRANFQSIWPTHLAGFTRLLVKLRDRFDGDLDLLLVLAVIGDRTRPENWTPELLTYRQMTQGGSDEHRQYPINIQSVSEYSGIPRETVRRKVSVLQTKGWVTRDADGRLAVSPAAAEELEDATNDSIAYLEALLTVFDATRDHSS